MKRVWGFAFFWFGIGMIANYFLDGFWSFLVLILAFACAYLLFCRC